MDHVAVSVDAVVVGSGPNGLTAAVELAAAGRSVLVVEASAQPGGAASSRTDVLSGAIVDPGSAVHPLGVVSPAFAAHDLTAHGLEWLHPEVAVAHPLDRGEGAHLVRDLDASCTGLGDDADRWRWLHRPVTETWDQLADVVLGPLLRVPRHPLVAAAFGVRGMPPATVTARALRTEGARALLAGGSAHAVLPLSRPLTTAFGLLLNGLAHVGGWPLPSGGAQSITDALVARLTALGGRLETGRPVRDLGELPPAGAVLLDLAPWNAAEVAGPALDDRYRQRLASIEPGVGIHKVDWLLDAPVPWSYAPARRAGTVHVGGTAPEVAAAERAAAGGRLPEHPFVLCAQPSVVDPARAAAGRHVLWGYAHVPAGDHPEATARIEAAIERFAPGFGERIVERAEWPGSRLEAWNANLRGGAITGGSHSGLGLLRRPVLSLTPYATPADGLYLCSSATPPGGGVHGMCGWHAARAVLGRELR